jgi:hypothetical protein
LAAWSSSTCSYSRSAQSSALQRASKKCQSVPKPESLLLKTYAAPRFRRSKHRFHRGDYAPYPTAISKQGSSEIVTLKGTPRDHNRSDHSPTANGTRIPPKSQVKRRFAKLPPRLGSTPSASTTPTPNATAIADNNARWNQSARRRIEDAPIH